MTSTDERWILATQNVARQVFDLQMAEFRRLTKEEQPPDLSVGGEVERFVEVLAMQTRTHVGNAGGTWTYNGFRYEVITIIRTVRMKYNLGLKECKDIVERVLPTL